MIVKFLAKSKTFKGVRYNTNKVEKDKGELMKVSGFGVLQGMSQLFPQDYINYLNFVSARNKRVVYPQLHAIISAKGKESSKEELTEIAEKWLKQMGYAEQPYLIIFHKDTRNHHVHIVSTRVDKTSGKKISSAFEKLRAMTAINKVMKQDEKLIAKADWDNALKYNFQTKAQFMMILENKGYHLKEKDEKLSLIKFGKVLLESDMAFLKSRKANYQTNQARARQITALIHKYKLEHSPVLRPVTEKLPGGFEKEKSVWTSDLAAALHRMFGIQLVFHSTDGKMPYGYSVLDHSGDGNVFKGGEIMDIKDLLFIHQQPKMLNKEHFEKPIEKTELSSSPHQLADSADHPLTYSSDPLLNRSIDQEIHDETMFIPIEQPIQISISDDIDDEAIHGRNRQRKRKARTNTR